MLYAKFDSNWPCVSGEVNGNVKVYDDRQLWLSLANTSKWKYHRMQRNDIPITHKFEDWQETKIPIEVVKCECASRVLWFLLFLMSHTLRDLSSEALRMYFPPGWNTSPLTQLSCPVYKKEPHSNFSDIFYGEKGPCGVTWALCPSSLEKGR